MNAVWVVIIVAGLATAVLGMWWAQRDLTCRGQRAAVAAIGVGVVIAAGGVVGIA